MQNPVEDGNAPGGRGVKGTYAQSRSHRLVALSAARGLAASAQRSPADSRRGRRRNASVTGRSGMLATRPGGAIVVLGGVLGLTLTVVAQTQTASPAGQAGAQPTTPGQSAGAGGATAPAPVTPGFPQLRAPT